jgi:hypothetical protein
MQNHFHEYCSHLVNTHKTNKPVKKDTLLNSIKSKFNSTVTVIDANQLVETLVKNGVIAINADKVIYNQQKLNQFANK